MRNPLLQGLNLVKSFRQKRAVDNLNIVVEPGECVALLGPNGAGKTTTCELLEGFISPDSGEVRVFGETYKTSRVKILQRIGVQLQETVLYGRLTVLETLQLFASFYEKPGALQPLLSNVGLWDERHQMIRDLSGGQRQRVFLACATVHNPDLLFLDEPTTGLDPQTKRGIWTLLQRFRDDGKGILLTTHGMDEAEELADRVVLIDKGRVVAEGTPSSVIREYRPGQRLKFDIDVPREGKTPSEINEALAAARRILLNDLPWLSPDRNKQSDHEVHQFSATLVSPEEQLPELFRKAKIANLHVHHLSLRPYTLEDVFLTITGHSLDQQQP